jgi:superfamily II DNA or RNA helicase
VAWHPGEHVILRGADWRVLSETTYGDCAVLDLTSIDPPQIARTVLLPFDRPRQAPAPRLTVVSRRRWSEHTATVFSRGYPYGGLRFCPGTIQLLAYQLEPALAVFRHGATRVLVGDDVGLGKTVEGGVIVREVVGRAADARTLIVLPAALKSQWRRELAALFELEVVDVTPAWLRTIARELPPDVNPWSIPGVYLASIDFLKRPEVLSAVESVRWDLLVVDEAHGATPGSDRLAAVDALGCRSSVVVLLSATPHSGSREQFEALCRIGAGPARSPLVCFRRSRADVDLAQPAVRSRVWTVAPTAHEHEMHRRLEQYTARLWDAAGRDRNPALLATVFRKRALSSAASLAVTLLRRLAAMESPPLERQPWLPLSSPDEGEDGGDQESQAVLAGAGLEDGAIEKTTIERCLVAAEAAARAESKTSRLLRLLSRTSEAAIVFSEYRDTAMLLHGRIGAIGRPVLLLHGGLSVEERSAVVAAFARGGAVLVATDAASEGLNLHHRCRVVVHYELPWSFARLHQRCGRVNRIGQQRRVHEIALVAGDTAEQLVVHPLLRRAMHASEFLSSSLPDALIAARVLGDAGVLEMEKITTAAATARQFTTLDLREEARAEVERLQALRRFRRIDLASPGLTIPVLRASRRMGSVLTMVVVVGFGTDGGDVVEETMLPITVAFAGRGWRRGRSALRRQAASALEEVRPHLTAAIDAFARSRVIALNEWHRPAVEARAVRRRAMTGALTSAARMLVQPGLFGRAAMRSDRVVAADVPDEPEGSTSHAHGIAWRSSVVAIVCGGWP